MPKSEQRFQESHYDPKIKRKVTKTYSVTEKRSADDCKRLCAEWKAKMRADTEEYYANNIKFSRERFDNGECELAPVVPDVTKLLPEEPFKMPWYTRTGQTVVIFGSSRSGKSTLLVHMLNKIVDDSCITTMFLDNPQAGVYKALEHKSKYVIADRFQPELIRYAHRIQKGTKNREYEFCFCYDDIVIGAKESPEILKQFTTYRNSKMSIIINLQDSTLLKKTNRGNVNWCIFMRMNNTELTADVINRYLKSYLPGNLKQQCEVYQQLVSDYHFLLLDNLEGKLTRHKIYI